MSDLRPPLHQPPNPDDLRRAPPAGPECAAIRGLLRDFADGDLALAEQRLVEEHVHRCFACSVELSRAEHEVLRLRRGFAALSAVRGRVQLPDDFAARVVDHIIDGAPAAPTDDGVAHDAGRGADAAGRDGSGSDGASRPRRSVPAWTYSPVVLMASVAMLLICFGALSIWSIRAEHEPDRTACLIMTEASGVFGDAGRRLRIGDGVGEAQWLRVTSGGSAKVDWHDMSSGSQPAATLAMNNAGQMRLQKGAPMLLDGTVAIETNRPVEVPVADGSKVQLGIGDYVIVADAPTLADDYQSQLLDPLASAPGDLRVRVEVLRGQDAMIVRAQEATLVAAGSVGIYEGRSGVTVIASGGQLAVADTGGSVGGGQTAPSAAQMPTLAASVYQRSGLPSVGTQVFAAFAVNGASTYRGGASDAYGVVTLAMDFQCESDFAVLHAVPAQNEFGTVAPDAFPLVRDGVHVRVPQALVLDLAEPVTGTVVDDQGQPRLGVRILPCVVDEVFQDLFPLNNSLGVTDEQGRFQVRRMSATLPHYQHLAMILVHPELQPTIVPVPVRGGANALLPMAPVVMHGLRTVKLLNLPANSLVTIWEELPGVQAGRAVWQRQFPTDGNGRVVGASVGSGDLWFVPNPGSGQEIRRMSELASAGPLPVYLASAPMPTMQWFRPLENLAGTNLYVASSYRHQRFDLPPVSNTAAAFTMVARDSLNRPVASAQVFAVTSTGPRGTAEGRFLGLTSAQGVISLEPVRFDGDLVVIGPDGSSTFLSNPQQFIPRLDARLAPSGRAVLAPALRPSADSGESVVTLHFRRQLGGMQGVELTAERFVSAATGWECSGLAPGLYSVRVDDHEGPLVTVPEQGFVTIE